MDKKKFWTTLQQEFTPEVEDKVMTIAEELRQEGIQKGMEKKEIEIIQRLLLEKTELEFIAKITGLSITKIKELQKNLH